MKQRMMAIGFGVALAGALVANGDAASRLASASAATLRAHQVNGPAAVQTALLYLGTRYVANGTRPDTGFDDVGFVQWVYAQQGIALPRDLYQLRAMARRVHAAGLHPGHLIFFKNTVRAGLSHVAIYIGHGQFVHAEWYGRGVVTSYFVGDPVDGNYWATHYFGRLNLRPLPSGSGSPPPAPITGTAVVVAVHALNLRSWPSLSAPIVNILPEGTRLTVTAVRPKWIHVRVAGGKSGWVGAQFVSLLHRQA